LIEIVDLTLVKVEPHPTLENRIRGKVAALVREGSTTHRVTVPVFAVVNATMTASEIDNALIAKARSILTKISVHLGTSGPSEGGAVE
jgi:hypothetical protein